MITIITVTFNCVDEIEATLSSVQELSEYLSVRHIVIDGGSSDGTLAKVELFSKAEVYVGPDSGIYDALNKGIAKIKNNETIVGILHAGDCYNVELLVKVLKEFSDGNFSILCGSIAEGEAEGSKKIHLRSDYRISVCNPKVKHPGIFVKKSIYDSIGVFDTRYKISSDFDFLCRALRSGSRIIYTDEVLTDIKPFGVSGNFKNFLRKKTEHLRIGIKYLKGISLLTFSSMIIKELFVGIVSFGRRNFVTRYLKK